MSNVEDQCYYCQLQLQYNSFKCCICEEKYNLSVVETVCNFEYDTLIVRLSYLTTTYKFNYYYNSDNNLNDFYIYLNKKIIRHDHFDHCLTPLEFKEFCDRFVVLT